MTTKLHYFDCNCSVGRFATPHLLDLSDTAALLAEMATAGVDEALVYHSVARLADPAMGNALLPAALAGHPELHPCWVILPPSTDEIPSGDALRSALRDAGVRTVRMYPGRDSHSFSLAEWCSGDTLATLEDARVPLLLDAETVSWDEVHTVLRDHSDLPVVMTNCSYRHNRYLYPLFEAHETLRVELSRFMGAGAIEDVVARFGSRPLLFGTNMPQYTGTAAVGLLSYAEIEDDDRAAIAGGNLRRLLEEARP